MKRQRGTNKSKPPELYNDVLALVFNQLQCGDPLVYCVCKSWNALFDEILRKKWFKEKRHSPAMMRALLVTDWIDRGLIVMVGLKRDGRTVSWEHSKWGEVSLTMRDKDKQASPYVAYKNASRGQQWIECCTEAWWFRNNLEGWHNVLKDPLFFMLLQCKFGYIDPLTALEKSAEKQANLLDRPYRGGNFCVAVLQGPFAMLLKREDALDLIYKLYFSPINAI